jgi:hypothetical protein
LASTSSLETHVAAGSTSRIGVPGAASVGEREDALVVRAQPELHRRTEHAGRREAADLAPFDGHAALARDDRADAGERVLRAHLDVGRAAHHLEQLAGPVVDAVERQAGLGDALAVHDLPDDERGQVGAQRLHRVERGRVGAQQPPDLRRREVVRDEGAEPLVRGDHRVPLTC